MAHVTLASVEAGSAIGDQDAQLVGGDLPGLLGNHVGRPVMRFDDTDEMAFTSRERSMPGQYTGAGTLKATVNFAMESDNANDIAVDIFVEAKTPNADTIDMESATGWDTANSGTVSLAGSTAGDPLALTITLTNKDGLVAGDLVRFGIRRDTDSGDDDASDELFIYDIEIWEDT